MEPDKAIEDIRQEEYSLPSGFEWDTLNIEQPVQVNMILLCLSDRVGSPRDYSVEQIFLLLLIIICPISSVLLHGHLESFIIE